MRRVLLALPFLATSMAFAQSPVQAPARPFTLKHIYPLGQPPASMRTSWSCPVGITAEQQATGATQWVVSLEDARSDDRISPGRMGVHVNLKAPTAFRKAQLAVYFMVPPTGAMMVSSQPQETSRTFDIWSGDDPAAELERSLLLGSGVSVTRVKLLVVTYADGTVWQPAANYNCSVRVSHFMRVAAAH
ncbi:hypothetical protein SAMN05421771_0923 [Granulicella pectinivorans]|uniref:Uncharacterized protein n=1 Tax=Granulicella pectinivorans TaxID=474950 RepID=A0A1I6LMJ2_9BACT|nr:hypothetical protein [Granulicella pectinivorans]SFS04462.1 hypothetical protein SAMN05421771_0923 [Granulicella pectinivorans]